MALFDMMQTLSETRVGEVGEAPAEPCLAAPPGSAGAPLSRPKTLRLGSLTLASRYFLSPLAGYTNMPFRVAVRELGGLGLATTELVSTRALLLGSRKTDEFIETCPADSPFAVQIYGADAKEMCEAAQWLENYGAAVIDINMGCPVPKVVKNGGGSAMMCNVAGTTALVRSIVEAVRIPVTVKMRLGWDEQTLTAPRLARAFEQAGVASVMVHGRTREQGFSGRVNLDGIRSVVEAVEKMPIIGNGDVRSIADAERMFAVTGSAGIAIGRGALLNPWIFAQLCSWETSGQIGSIPTYDQRLDFMARHYGLLVEQARRTVCEPDVPQVRRLVFARPEAGQGDTSAFDDAGMRGRLRGDRDDAESEGAAGTLESWRDAGDCGAGGADLALVRCMVQ